jgi:hypothetical protein
MQNPLRQRLVTSALAFLVGMGIGNAAVARDIAGPHVKAGEFRLKNSGFLGFNDNDNSRLSNSTELSYGLTDRIALKAEGDWNKGYSDRMRYRNTELKAQYELFQPGEAWIDTAVELGYVVAADPNRADEVNFEFLLQKDYLRMRHRANIEFAQQIGEFSEGSATWSFDWQSVYKITPALLAGLEYYGTLGEVEDVFGNFSDEEHLIGPVVVYDIPDMPISMEVGYLFGITDESADHGVKWRISVAF